MKSVLRNEDFLSSNISVKIFLLRSLSFVATSVLILKTLSASLTLKVPSAESLRPLIGKTSGPL